MARQVGSVAAALGVVVVDVDTHHLADVSGLDHLPGLDVIPPVAGYETRREPDVPGRARIHHLVGVGQSRRQRFFRNHETNAGPNRRHDHFVIGADRE